MKKILTLALCMACITPTIAQNKKEKNPLRNYRTFQKNYLPKQGDFGITFSVTPFTNIIGTMFSEKSVSDHEIGGSTLGRYYFSNQYINPSVALAGKYFFTDQLAMRVNFGMLCSKTKNGGLVQNDALYEGDLPEELSEYVKTGNVGGSLSAAVEYRIGKGRFQGVFGGGLIYAVASRKVKFDYANEMSIDNTEPTVSAELESYGIWNTHMESEYFTKGRVLELKDDDSNHSFGAIGFAGVEYFLAPKISLGAEVNLVMVYSWRNEKSIDIETVHKETGERIVRSSIAYPKQSSFLFGTQNIGGNLNLNFYF